MTSKNALTFIFITVLIDVIGIGIILPVLPQLIQELTGQGLSEASRISGWLLFSFAVMQFLFSSVMGGLSDRFGRRPVILLSLFGLGLDYVLMYWAPTLGWLFVGRVLAGVTGASFSAAGSYIADVSEPEKKAQNFGLIGVAFGLGFIIGPVLGGIASMWGPRIPFAVAAILALGNGIYGFFFLPESLPLKNRRPFDWRRANPIGSLMQLRKYPVVSGLVISLVLIYIASHSVQSNWSFYTMFKFKWNSTQVGYSLGIVGVLIAAVQGGLIRWLIPKLGTRRATYLGLAMSALGLLLFSMASTGWMMIVFLIPYCLGGIAGPSIQGIISSAFPTNAQGELQGALTSLMSATSIVGPLLMNTLFFEATRADGYIHFPGAAFLLGAILMAFALFFSWRTLRKYMADPTLDSQKAAANS
ncbi:MAG TPA: TCR/Tet family MFS transporter [Luteibaculaceae bacterium]|nr:TCR/Tet family MFS transporter [Luteibaculaceae bacterium]